MICIIQAHIGIKILIDKKNLISPEYIRYKNGLVRVYFNGSINVYIVSIKNKKKVTLEIEMENIPRKLIIDDFKDLEYVSCIDENGNSLTVFVEKIF